MAHTPRILPSRGWGCWLECGCGWMSRKRRTRLGATLDWIDHLKVRL